MHTELFVRRIVYYSENIIAIRTCANWFKRFKNDDINVNEHSERPAAV